MGLLEDVARTAHVSHDEERDATEALSNADLDKDGIIGGKAPRKTFAQAAWQIVIADVSMSLDNVLAVAGAARDHPTVLVIGLVLSIALMGLAATLHRPAAARYRWIAYIGLAIILYVAVKMVLDRGRAAIPRALRFPGALVRMPRPLSHPMARTSLSAGLLDCATHAIAPRVLAPAMLPQTDIYSDLRPD